MKPLLSSIPANVFVNTDFPEPDSPTIAIDSFSYISKEIPRIAVNTLPLTWNFTSKSFTDNNTFLSIIISPTYVF